MKDNPDYLSAAEALLSYCRNEDEAKISKEQYDITVAKIVHAVGLIKRDEEPIIKFTVGNNYDDFAFEVAHGNYFALTYILWEFMLGEKHGEIVKKEYAADLELFPEQYKKFVNEYQEYIDYKYAAC